MKFLKWTREYSGWWYLICTPNNGYMNLKIMRHIISQLEKESLYELIFVLLMVHRDAPYMKNFSDCRMLEMMIKRWKDDEQSLLKNTAKP